MKKIIVIDDNQDSLEILSYVLSDKGYEVVCAKNPDILEDLGSPTPDLILLDIWLGETNGANVCGELKSSEATKDIPVVLISAANNLEEIAKRACADSFVRKPYDLDTIIMVVNDLLSDAPKRNLSLVQGGL